LKLKVGDVLPAAIRVLIVEDHPVFQEGLALILTSQSDISVVAAVANANDAIAEFHRHRPDITLMDQRLPGSTGTEALIAIRTKFPQARVIMLTTSEGDIDIKRSLEAGAVAYVLKSTPKDELLHIIRSVHSGRKHIPPEVASRLAEYMGEEWLTARELEVLKQIRAGHRNKEIAFQLSISETTVNFHVRNLIEKLRANDRAHAVSIAIRRGFLEPHG
jgi:DNA-binding NarL/FixJ family response regulator